MRVFIKNIAKLTESYICRRHFFNKVEGCRLKKKTLVQVHSCEFRELFKNYLAAHVRTAASDILGYPYVGYPLQGLH